jgi:formylglycine-generating enzyme required for sulfatase activity
MRQASFTQRSTQEPVVRVTYLDAQKFCEWLTDQDRKLGLLSTRQRYRLPTTSEWRSALGTNIGPNSPYLWGTSSSPPARIANLRGREWNRENSFGSETLQGYEDGISYTAPVGSFGANASGFCDLIGNVWEFCEKQGQNGQMIVVALGGSWDTSDREELRLSFEKEVPSASVQWDDVGFRCRLVEEDK